MPPTTIEPALDSDGVCRSLRLAAALAFLDLGCFPALGIASLFATSFFKDRGWIVFLPAIFASFLSLAIPLPRSRAVAAAICAAPSIAYAGSLLDSSLLPRLACIPCMAFCLCLHKGGVVLAISAQVHLEAFLRMFIAQDGCPVSTDSSFAWSLLSLSVFFTLLALPVIMGTVLQSLGALDFFLFAALTIWTLADVALTMWLFDAPVPGDSGPTPYQAHATCVLALLMMAGVLGQIAAVRMATRFSTLGNDSVQVVLRRPANGLSTTELRRLPIKKIRVMSQVALYRDLTCSVCQEEFLLGHDVLSLPLCRHVFHAQCIKRWLRRKATCPNCNLRLGPDRLIHGPQGLAEPLLEV